jgi:amidase
MNWVTKLVEGVILMRHIRRGELQVYAGRAGFRLDEHELDQFNILTEAMFQALERFDGLMAPEPRLGPATLRQAGRRPFSKEDPLNAIARWCRVKSEDSEGPLTGLKVALKDMISVAGVPMTCGSGVLRGYNPDADAELTIRLLRAGAEIVAITNMDAFAFSGGGETCVYGPIRNPFDLERTAGGSSGGSAACLYYDNIDIAWGGDTGGSVRVPASWCGVLGLKPTQGLVPTTGVASHDWRYDHVGPMARSVELLALAMDAVAEEKIADPNYPNTAVIYEREAYREAVVKAGNELKGLRIGVVAEGFLAGQDSHAPEGSRETADTTREAIGRLEQLGAEIKNISLPVLSWGADIMFSAMVEAATAAASGWPSGYHWWSEYSESFAEALHRGLRTYGDELTETFKAVMILGHYLNNYYGGSICAKAHRMASVVRRAFEDAFESVDVLAMPTTTHYAHKIEPKATLSERAIRGWGMLGNTAAFNVSGHPALSMPAASVKGIPIGIMIVGRRFGDAQLLALARVYEKAFGWEPKTPPVFER